MFPVGGNEATSTSQRKDYKGSELSDLVDALRRISATQMATPPDRLPPEAMNYILPMYPPSTMPEDVRKAF